MNPKVVLVAAGLGTRLGPLSNVLPKCLTPIAGQPLLGLWLAMLRNAGFREIVVNLHHHPDLVREYILRSPYVNDVVLSYEEELLGTGGTLLFHRTRLASGTTLFAHADNLSIFSLNHFLEAHCARPQDTVMTMMTFFTDAPHNCGILELDSMGRVVAMDEKPKNPKGNLANAAVYLIEPEVIDFIESLKSTKVDFSVEVLPHFMGRVYSYNNNIYHRDIGTPKSLAIAQLEYPIISRQNNLISSERDAWYGLLEENGGELSRTFLQAALKTYS